MHNTLEIEEFHLPANVSGTGRNNESKLYHSAKYLSRQVSQALRKGEQTLLS